MNAPDLDRLREALTRDKQFVATEDDLDIIAESAQYLLDNEPQVAKLVEALRQVSRMKTFPDHATNTATLVAAHMVAERALKQWEDEK